MLRKPLTLGEVQCTLSWEPSPFRWRDFFQGRRDGRKICTVSWGACSVTVSAGGSVPWACSLEALQENLTDWSRRIDAPARGLARLNSFVQDTLDRFCERFDLVPDASVPIGPLESERTVLLQLWIERFWQSYSARLLFTGIEPTGAEALLQEARAESRKLAPNSDPFLLGFLLGCGVPK